jgi:hypothetical protein
MANSVDEIWNRLEVDKSVAIDFIAVFARCEFALKCTGVLRGKAGRERRADANWEQFATAVERECLPEALAPVLDAGAYLTANPTRHQVVTEDNNLDWVDDPGPGERSRLSWLLRIVKTTRNNLFHGGKFWRGPQPEPLRDLQLIGGSIQVLLACLDLPCPSANGVKFSFWTLDAD